MKLKIGNMICFILFILSAVFLYLDNQTLIYYDHDFNFAGGSAQIGQSFFSMVSQGVIIPLILIMVIINIYTYTRIHDKLLVVVAGLYIIEIGIYFAMSFEMDFYKGLSFTDTVYYLFPTIIGLLICSLSLFWSTKEQKAI